MKQYATIIRSINGKLLFVHFMDGKQDTQRYVSNFVDMGYQATWCKMSVFLTADNFEEERTFAGEEKVI